MRRQLLKKKKFHHHFVINYSLECNLKSMISVLRMTLRCKKPPKSQCTVQCNFIQLLTKHQFTSIDHKHDKRYCITLYIHVHGCKNTMGIVAHTIQSL